VFVKEGEMELTRHFGRKRVGLLAVVAATALCAALVAATSASAAKLDPYAAELPGAPPDKGSQVDFLVKSKKNKATKKFRPVAIKKVNVTFLYLNNCSDQVPTRTSFTWGQLKASVPSVPDQIPVSGRRFSFSVTGGGQTEGGSDTFTFTFSGRVPRNGPPTGTLRYTTSFPRFTPDPVDPDAPGHWVQVSCDSGSLSWTAQRVDF
jgi:hypothetical protein